MLTIPFVGTCILLRLITIYFFQGNMKYKSTRDGNIEYTFEEAIFSGYAPDGGLFVPSTLPSITAQDLMRWSALSFPQLAYHVIRMFISPSEVSDIDLRDICNKSYPANEFDDESFVPVKRLGSAFIAELFHGPTFCFKDMGMRPVINLLSHFASLRNRATTLLVSTTGDTGPAAVSAVASSTNPLLTILVHYPRGQISDFQRKQLTTVDSKYVKIASFEGGGDDMDKPIKDTLLENANDGVERTYCGINSYNIGRPLFQMVHFIWIYLRTVEKLGVEPGGKGAMGNITGGYMAKQMGVPIGRLCAAVNTNDITHRVIQRGEFHKRRIQKTLSDAINIEVPYNFERIAFYATGCNYALIKKWMMTMEQTQQLTLEDKWLEILQVDFLSARVTDNEMCNALRKVHDKLNYVADPHTSVAMAAAEMLGYEFTEEQPHNKMMPMVLVATASPCKFQHAVEVALGEDGWRHWEETNFPARALKTLEMKENTPFHYPKIDGVSMIESQSKWRKMMIDIVNSNF